MARYMVATHRAAIERDWLCKRCSAFGTVTVDAFGRGEKRVWLSKTNALDAADERAQYAMHDDAEAVIRMVRCPTCGKRARGAFGALMSITRDLLLAGFVAGLGGIALFLTTKNGMFSSAIGAVSFLLVLGFGHELRRRRAAGRARVKLAPKAASRPAVEPVRAPQSRETDPFRAPPAPPPLAVIKPEIETAAPRAKSESGEQPAFLS